MCALLNFLPDLTVIRPVDRPMVLADGHRDVHPGDTCYLAHEIGRGHYYAYVWGSQARAFFRLAARGHIIASNLHADTLEETRDQLCRENGVAQEHLDAVTLQVYLRVERAGGWAVRRRVSHVYESDRTRPRLLWTSDRSGTFARHEPAISRVVSLDQEQEYAAFLSALLRRDIRSIADVRRAVIRRAREE
jgi:hypothetical protein